jgi:hypothetical protein
MLIVHKTKKLVLGVLSLCFVSVVSAGPITKEQHIQFDSQHLVSRDGMSVTLADFVAHVERNVPAEDRVELISSPTRIEGLLDNILTAEAFIGLADKEGYLADDVAQARLMGAVSREARALFRDRYFEENELDSYTTQARELFMINPGQFVSQQTIDLEQILVTVTEERDEVAAMSRIIEVYQRLVAGEPFSEVAAAYTDDPTFEQNGGVLKQVDPAQLVPPVALALEDLELNAFSQPVRSSFGWHVFRITQKNEPVQLVWEQARPIAEAMARERHLSRAFERILRELNGQEMIFQEGAVEAILKHYGLTGFGPFGSTSGVGPDRRD